MENQTIREGEPNGFNPDADRYPTFNQALRRIQTETEIPDGPVERLELHCHASGEVTYRVWGPRAEEPEGGYLPPA